MKTTIIAITTVLIALLGSEAFAAPTVMPIIGASVPVASSADIWSNGFMFGLQLPLKDTRHGYWSAIGSFQQVSPNAKEMLQTDGRDMKVEESEGVSRIVEVGIIGDRSLWSRSNSTFEVGVQYGASLFFVSDQNIHLKGAYFTESTAVTREINRKGENLVIPGLTLGGIVNLPAGATLSMRIQHIFTAESGRDLLFVGLGLRPF